MEVVLFVFACIGAWHIGGWFIDAWFWACDRDAKRKQS